MAEAAVALAGITVCWLIGVVTYEDEMSLVRYAVIAILCAFAAYFTVRFVHWAWMTPLPFVGTTQ
ncbi:MAG: hypothetical protein ACRD59_05390 [Candidatus Acidiferrales bacterium]